VLREIFGPAVEKVKARRCRLTLSNPVLKPPTAPEIETVHDEKLSNVAFKFNLRCYIKVEGKTWKLEQGDRKIEVGPDAAVNLQLTQLGPSQLWQLWLCI